MISVGLITPHAAVGPAEEFEVMAPGRLTTRVVRVPLRTSDAGTLAPPPSSPADLRELTSARFLDDAAEVLTAGPIDVIGHASTSSGYAIGFDAESAMISMLERKWRVPAVATCVSAALACETLGIDRIQLVHPPWFDDDLNRLGVSFFESQGFRVVRVGSAELSKDSAAIESEAVYEWTRVHVADDAEGIFIGGNGFRAANAIDRLEAALERPVLESNQVLLWSLLRRSGATVSLAGYGRLLAGEQAVR